MSFATRSRAAATFAQRAPGLAAASDTLTDGTNTLIITKAEIVLREVELKQQEAANCDVEPAGCEDVEFGPVVVDLPLGRGAQQQFFVEIPPGTYRAIEFEIHKVSSDDPATFRQQYPYLADQSIRVQGTYNDQPFTFLTDLNVEQTLLFNPLLVVTDTTTATNVTILVSLAAWFVGPDHKLRDPATGNKGGVNESMIKENIKQSMEAFEDHDFDGQSDP
ncbi:MAG: hypothetical protein HYV20_16285 [Gemmatimonadetes bacterium]|nr:hypothetical protein [Gemmatimonadota bacterium]